MARLRAEGSDLYLGSELLRGHIGWNSFFPFERAFTTSETTWQLAIDHAAAVGSKVMRVPIAPRYKNNLQTYVWTFSSPNYTLRASYITKVNEILDYAESKGVSLIISPFFRYPDAADVVGQTVSTTGDPASLARAYMRQILAQMLTAFGNHPAIAGWCMSNEVDNYAWGTGGTISANTGLGTPASYSVPADHLTLAGLNSWFKEFSQQIKSFNNQLFVVPGHVGNARNNWGAPGETYWRNKELLYPSKHTDAMYLHLYWEREGSSRNPESYGLLCQRYAAWEPSKPLIFGEMGESNVKDPDGSISNTMKLQAKNNNVSLILEWQLCPIAQDPTFGIWPGEDRGNQRMDYIRELNRTPGLKKSSKFTRIKLYPKQAQVARCGGTGNGEVSVPDDPILNPIPFSVTVWSKPYLGTSGSTYRKVVEKVGGTPVVGWNIQHNIGSHVTNYGAAFPTLFIRQGGTGASINRNGQSNLGHLGKWKHFAMTFDGTTLWHYVDGIPYGNTTVVTAGYTFEHALTALRIGQPLFVGEIADVRIYDRVITQNNILDIINGEEVADGLVGRWKLDGDSLDSSGNDNHGNVLGDISFIPNDQYKDRNVV